MSDITFYQVVRNRHAQPFFLQYLHSKHLAPLLLFYLDVEQFKELVGKSAELKAQATKLADVHFGTQPCLPYVGQVEFDRVLAHIRTGKPTLDMFTGAQRQAGKRLKSEFAAFTRSQAFSSMLTELKLRPHVGTLHDTLRDPRRVRVLFEYLQIDRPTEMDVLRFCLELRNKYAPLVAEAMAPADPSLARPALQGRRMAQMKRLLELARDVSGRFLRPGAPQLVPKLSQANMEKVLTDLDELTRKAEQLDHAPQPGALAPGASGSARVPSWARPSAAAAAAAAAPQTPATPVDDVIRGLAELFRPCEDEAVRWLEKVALNELARSDFYLPPNDQMITPPPPPPPDADREQGRALLSVWPLLPQEKGMRDTSPHVVAPAPRVRSECLPLSMVRLSVFNPPPGPDSACDMTGPTVLDVTRGCKFRRFRFFTWPQAPLTAANSVLTALSSTHPPAQAAQLPELPVLNDKVQSLAGVSAAEVSLVARHRLKMVSGGFDASSLALTELHAHCFPLGLAVEVSPPSHQPEQNLVHAFVVPCQPHSHSSDSGCSCLYGVCVTRRADKQLALVDHRTSSEHAARAYSESAVALTKVPQLGLGITMSLNRDSCVVVSRFISEVGVPSPAAASGKVAVDDVLLSVNSVPVVGRGFNDIISQVKVATGAISLRFARGRYVETVGAAPAAPSENSKAEAKPLALPTQYTCRVPECVALLSRQPVFAKLRDALEDWGFGEADDVRGAVGRIDASSVLEDLSRVVFDALSVPLVVDLLSSLLLEKRVLLISDRPDALAPVFQGLRDLLWPFHVRREWLPLISESRVDWFASKVGASQPFFAGLCTVDVLPPPPAEKSAHRRHGRFVHKEEAWSSREKDSAWPSERVLVQGATRQGVATLLEGGTIVVDLDADCACGGPPAPFPPAVRDELIRELNVGLGRGGLGSEFGSLEPRAHAIEPNLATRQALHRAYAKLVDGHEQYIVSVRDDVVIFYKHEYLAGAVQPPLHDWVATFVETQVFAHFCKCGYEFTP